MRIYKALLEGRECFVVPTVLIVEGVLDGSAGPILYPAAELKKTAMYWNGKPVCVYHPDMYGSEIAGCPEVFSKQRVGTLFNVRFDGKEKSLKGECWIDVERVGEVSKAVHLALQQGDMVEVSTGLYAEYEKSSGMFGPKRYEAIARDHRPDHLAILPDQEGACSIADGAGLCRNAKIRCPDPFEPMLL